MFCYKEMRARNTFRTRPPLETIAAAATAIDRPLRHILRTNLNQLAAAVPRPLLIWALTVRPQHLRINLLRTATVTITAAAAEEAMVTVIENFAYFCLLIIITLVF